MINLKPYLEVFLIGLLVGTLAGFFLCKRFTPTPQPEIRTVEKVVTKTNTKVITKEVVKPDGTKETLTVSDTNTDSKQDSSSSTTPSFSYHYKLSPMVGYSFNDNRQTYGIMGEKYLTPGLTVGVYVFPLDKHGGFTFGMSF
jgi:hypothetical protein